MKGIKGIKKYKREVHIAGNLAYIELRCFLDQELLSKYAKSN